MQGLFSKRFQKALEDKTIERPSFRRALRRRLAMVCHDHSETREWYGEYESTTGDAIQAIKKAYGAKELRVQDVESNGKRNATGFDDFVTFAYPTYVLDALEVFYRLLSEDGRHPFQSEVNAVLREESSPWLMSDGFMYRVDSHFLDALKGHVEEEMRQENFLGALDEFKDARKHLQSGDVDDAIHNANRAFESALKTLLNLREGTADQLLKKLRKETALLDSVPVEAQKALVSKVLQALPVLRHKIGGHGQGDTPVEIPTAYGELAVNLAASYIKFLSDLKKELIPPSEDDPYELNADEDLPF